MIEIAPEEWRPVVGWPGYEVSTRGRVRSVERVVLRRNGTGQTIRGRVLKPATMKKSGHLQVSLSHDGARRTYCVHTLVLEAFVGPRPESMEGLHGDGNPANNNIGNLKWGTPTENHLDRVLHGVHHMSKRTSCSQGHPFNDENTYRAPGNPSVRRCRTCRRNRSGKAMAA